MEFITKLKGEAELSVPDFPPIFSSFKKEEFTPRHTHPLVISEDIYLSIQGSAFHYSWPKATVDYHLYISMEVALVIGGNLVKIHNITNDVDLIKEFDHYYSSPVYANVPVELIEKLYQDVKKHHGFYEFPTN